MCTRPTTGLLPPSLPVRALGDADVPALLALDRAVLGCERGAMLRARLAERDAACVADDGAGGLAGFAISLDQRGIRQVGPLVARDAGVATALVQGIAAGAAQLRLDVVGAHASFAASLGFEVRARRAEMSLADRPMPWAERSERFGLAAQAYG